MAGAMHLVRLLIAVLSCALFAPAHAEVAGYSPEPLQKPVFEWLRVVGESVRLNNWLNENHQTLTPQQRQGVREHLHVLVDSQVKEIYARDKVLLPKEPDPMLAVLFSWAGRFGVYGADEIFRRVRGNSPMQAAPGPHPPAGLDVALHGDQLKVSSASGGWAFAIPYHFFIFNLVNAVGNDGQRVQAALVSTGSAPDAAPPGYSQATLALFFTPDAKPDAFSRTWLQRYGIDSAIQPKQTGSTTFESRTAYDAKTRLYKEAVFIPSKKGVLMVLYMGLDGTYQWNRPHFLDFLANLQIDQ